MRKLFLILAISVAIAVLYGADSRAAPGDTGSGSLFANAPDQIERPRVRPPA